MTSRPLLLDSPIGPVGIGLTEPSETPTGAVLLLPGGARRTGPNRLWPRLASSLAMQGFTVARMDLPGHGDSDLIPPGSANDLAAARHAARWFADYVRTNELVLVCGCYGSRLAGAVLDEVNVTGAGLIVPYLRTRYPNMRAARVRGRVTRALVRRRPSTVDKKMVRTLALNSNKTPLWILVGEKDVSARYVGEVKAAAKDQSRVHIEVLPDVAIHTHSSPVTQDMTIEHVTRWAHEHAGSRQKV